jgi:hypothetical protein
VYEGGIGVPLVVVGRAVVAPGTETAALVHAVDVFDTVAAMAGVDVHASGVVDATLDGVSFLPFLAEPGGPAVRQSVYAERFGPNGPGPYTSMDMVSVVAERFKLIRDNLTGREELYDLEGVVQETDDLLLAPLSPVASDAYDFLGAELDSLGLAYDVPRLSPTIGDALITPAFPTTWDDLYCIPRATYDFDGDLVFLTFVWEVDGKVVEPVGRLLESPWFEPGSAVVCSVTPYDVDGVGPTRLASVTIRGG